MPSLLRFLFTLAVLGGIAYGGMSALTVFVEPDTREMSVRVPTSKLDPQRILPPRPAPVATDDAQTTDADGEAAQ